MDEAAPARPGPDRGPARRRRLRARPGPARAGQPHPGARPGPDAQPAQPAPWDLQQFRSYLGTASGSQSVQFRELELRSGLREPAYLKALEIEYGGRLPEPLATRLAQRSLAEAHAGAAARLGIDDLAGWADFYVDPGPRTDFYLVCEALVDYDERWIRWRQEHVALVQRTLGDHARGTGGMAIAYLQRTTRYRFFPVLWALRDELVVRGGGQLVGRTRHETS